MASKTASKTCTKRCEKAVKKHVLGLYLLWVRNDFRVQNYDFSAAAPNRLVLVIEAVPKLKITGFQQLPRVDRLFVTLLWFCRVPIEDFPKNHGFGHCFEHQHEVICKKKVFKFCDFERSGRFSRPKSQIFSSCPESPRAGDRNRSGTENHCFSAIASCWLIFRDISVIFVGSTSRIFRKITVFDTVLSTSTR